ncbi:MAG: hypothetical protein JWO03_1084 [Bacteroidetes bacterium]|nr:hypothetical protein [Bacteroidota bacterium]
MACYPQAIFVLPHPEWFTDRKSFDPLHDVERVPNSVDIRRNWL